MENQASNSAMDTTGKVITCKAAVVWGPGEPFVIEQVRVDPPEKMEVRLKILFTSVCHTDLSAWKGQMPGLQRPYPVILGHEAVGIVESVGEGVSDVEAGDFAIPLFNGECGNCVYCKCEKTNKCVNFGVEASAPVMVGDGRSRFSTAADGKPISHFFNTSTFSEYTVVQSACVVKIDPDAPMKKMTLLGCGISSGVGAAWNTANVQAGSTVAVFGLGAVGLAVAEGARSRGASKIIGVDINPNKFIKGKAVGINEFINPLDSAEKPVNEIIKEMTDGGVDYSFECAGNLQALRQAFLSTHEGWGVLTLVGIQLSPDLLPIHPMELFSGRTILTSLFGGFKGRTQLPTFIQQCVSGLVNLDEFITHELPLEDINRAAQLLVDGVSLRSVLHF